MGLTWSQLILPAILDFGDLGWKAITILADWPRYILWDCWMYEATIGQGIAWASVFGGAGALFTIIIPLVMGLVEDPAHLIHHRDVSDVAPTWNGGSLVTRLSDRSAVHIVQPHRLKGHVFLATNWEEDRNILRAEWYGKGKHGKRSPKKVSFGNVRLFDHGVRQPMGAYLGYHPTLSKGQLRGNWLAVPPGTRQINDVQDGTIYLPDLGDYKLAKRFDLLSGDCDGLIDHLTTSVTEMVHPDRDATETEIFFHSLAAKMLEPTMVDAHGAENVTRALSAAIEAARPGDAHIELGHAVLRMSWLGIIKGLHTGAAGNATEMVFTKHFTPCELGFPEDCSEDYEDPYAELEQEEAADGEREGRTLTFKLA